MSFASGLPSVLDLSEADPRPSCGAVLPILPSKYTSRDREKERAEMDNGWGGACLLMEWRRRIVNLVFFSPTHFTESPLPPRRQPELFVISGQ